MKSVCCRAEMHHPVHTYNETFSNADIQQLRADLLAGVKNPICRVCWYDESVGQISTRQDSIKNKSPQQLQAEIDQPKLKWLWIDPGNYCNLACRTCYPTFSTSVGVEWSRRYHNKNIIQIKKPNIDVLIDEDLSALETLMILGGEPFLDRKHFDLISSVISQKNCVEFNIFYVTNNIKRIPDQLLDILRQYPGIKLVVTASIDATGKQFEYIRTKGRWHDFSENMHHLISLSKVHPNLTYTANITISLLNCLYLDDLYQWLADHEISNITTAFVEGADQYSFMALSESQKQKLIKTLMESKHNLSFVAKSVATSAYDPLLIDRFWQDVEWTRSYYGLIIDDYLPKLVDLINVR